MNRLTLFRLTCLLLLVPSIACADGLMLHRIQFAANISFHILFPTITIALAWVLLYFKLRFMLSKDEAWMRAYGFWVKIFALSFALGVVSGITMSFQFGTNWPGFMTTIGNIAGPLLAYEVLTAFFLEATFLGIMLFGRQRAGERIHTLATFLVAFGTTMSAFWILVLNSWMHTPAGFEMRANASGALVAHATDWWAVIFNPSFPYRFAHMYLASFITVAFLLMGLGAYRWQRGDRAKDTRITLQTGLVMALTLLPLQIFMGDLHGLNTLQHQPAKLAAMEGIWETQKGAPAVLFALPDQSERRNRYELAIPNLASFYLTHDWNGEIKGLNDFQGQHPPVAPVFWSFRVMVGTGLLMLATSLVCAFLWWRRRRLGFAFDLPAWMLRALTWMSFSGWLAVLAGWYTTEIGRQPWLVQGVLTTAQAAASTPAPMVASTLALYLTTYAVLIAAYIRTVFYLARKASGAKEQSNADTEIGLGVTL
jgi:cytochrome bd ubiquinol oxidase subunit I